MKGLAKAWRRAGCPDVKTVERYLWIRRMQWLARFALLALLLSASAFAATSEGGDNRINIKPANGAVGSIRFFELIGNGTNYVELKCQPSLASNLILVLPGTNGTNGQALITDGSGNLSWGSVSADLSNLNASNLTSGTIPDARFPAMLPAIDGSQLTGLPSGDDASALTQGTLDDARLSANVPLLTAGVLPAVDGSLLTNLNGAALTAGSVGDAALSANVTLLGNGNLVPPDTESYTLGDLTHSWLSLYSDRVYIMNGGSMEVSTASGGSGNPGSFWYDGDGLHIVDGSSVDRSVVTSGSISGYLSSYLTSSSSLDASKLTGTAAAFNGAAITGLTQTQINPGAFFNHSTTGSQNNVAIGTKGNVRYTGAGNATFTGIVAATNGTRLIIHNETSSTITLAHEDIGSTAANRFSLLTPNSAFVIANYALVELVYDGGISRWLVVSSSAGGVPNIVSGGIPYFANTSFMASSGVMTANALILGGGAGTAPTPMGSLGTTTTVLHGNASGAPTFGAIVNSDITNATIDLTTKVTGTLPVGNGGTGITSLGTGVATALGINVGTAGAPVVLNGAGGTPSSITLTSGTGLPLTTGVTGTLPVANGGTGITSFGTGVATAHGNAVNGASGFVVLDGSSKLPAVDGSALTNLSGGDTYVYRTADATTKISNTTFADDGVLQFSVAANSDYVFQFYIYVTSTTGGFKYQFTGPASPTLLWHDGYTSPGGAHTLITAFSTAQNGFASNVNGNQVTVTGMLRNGANAGTVVLQWAQQTSDAAGTTVKAGSFLRYKKIN